MIPYLIIGLLLLLFYYVAGTVIGNRLAKYIDRVKDALAQRDLNTAKYYFAKLERKAKKIALDVTDKDLAKMDEALRKDLVETDEAFRNGLEELRKGIEELENKANRTIT